MAAGWLAGPLTAHGQSPPGASLGGPDFSPVRPIYVLPADQVRIIEPAPSPESGTGWDDAREFSVVQALAEQGQFRKALPMAYRALGAARADRVRWLTLTAWLERNTGELAAATRHLEEALTWCARHRDSRKAVVQAQMADLLRQRGDFAGSDRLWQELARVPATARLPQTLEGRGMALAELGDWTAAEQCLSDAVAAWTRQGGSALDRLQARHNLASFYVRLGFSGKAGPLLREITASPDLSPSHPLLRRSLVALACLSTRGGTDESPDTRALLRQRLEASSAAMDSTLGKESPAAASVLMALASLDFSEGNFAGAAARYQYALMIRLEKLGGEHPDTLTTLHDQGELLLVQGETGQARQKFGQAAAGFTRRLGARHPAAAAALERSALCAILLDRPGEAAALAERLAGVHASQHRCLLGFATSGEMAGFYRGGMPWDLPCLLENGPLALRCALLFKGTADEEMTRQQLLRTYAEKDPASRRLLLELQSARALLRQQTLQETTASAASLREAQEAVVHAERAMARTVHQHRATPYGRDLTLEALRRAVAPGGALVEYLKYRHRTPEQPAGEERYAAVVLSGHGGRTAFFPLGTSLELEGSVARFQELVQNPDSAPEALAAAAGNLYQKLWRPLAPFLKDVREIAVSPSGPLHFVPFAALPDDGGRFLCESVTVRLVASARDLLEAGPAAAPAPSRTALLVGNPFFNDSRALARRESTHRGSAAASPALPPQLGHLKEAETEVRALNDRLRAAGWQTGLLTDETATEDRLNFELGQGAAPALLHFATHGLFLDQRTGGPADVLSRGGLALAGAQTTLNQWFLHQSLPADRDGILLFDEVAALDLHGTELAVLSACQTGSGELLEAEGVMGLRRAFSVAGAQALLVSLWMVEDGETRRLMEAFYECWLAGAEPAAALQSAQMAALQRLRSLPGQGMGGAIRGAGAFIAQTRGPVRPGPAKESGLPATKRPGPSTSR